MKVHLHIDRLVLDGLALSARDGARVRAALETELVCLIGQHGWSGSLAGGAAPVLRTAPVHADGQGPDALGRQIAASLYGGLGR
jgi:hypothetical protein